MKITGLNHITINVVDLETSVIFYKTVLGLQQSGFINMGDHTLTYFDLPQNVRLELIDYMQKDPQKEHRETDIGTYRHFCLETDDLVELEHICKESGVLIRKSPAYVEKLSCSTMLVLDPNGVEIEIIKK